MSKIEIRGGGLFTNIITSINYLFEEINLKLTSTKMIISSIDAAGSTLVHGELLKTFFDNYICENDVEVNMFTSQFERVLKNSESNSKIEIIFIDKNSLEITDFSQYKKKYRLLSIESERLNTITEPNIEPELEFEINTESFHSIIKDIQAISEDIYIETGDNGLSFFGEGIYGNVNIQLQENNPQLKYYSKQIEISNIYDGDTLNQILRGGAYSEYSNILIMNGGPIKITFKIKDTGAFSFYLAPYAV